LGYRGRPRIVFRVAKLQGLPSGAPGRFPAVALLTSALGDDARLLATLEALEYAGSSSKLSAAGTFRVS